MDRRKLLLIPVFVAIVLGTGLAVQNSIAEEAQYNEIKKQVNDDGSKIYGHIVAKVFDKDGNLVQYTESDNLVVDVGLDGMVDRIFGSSLQTPNQIFDWVHIGTGSTFAPNATQTDLESPQGGACVRVQDASIDVTSAVSGETTATVEGAFDGGDCAGAIVEAGIFNNSTAGVMLARSTFGTVTIGSGDTLNVEYSITVT